MTKNELYHHGILGQKWGVRRYQNKDGTLTSAGKARRGGMAVKDRIQRLSSGIRPKAQEAVSKIRGVKDKTVEKWNGLTPGQKKALKVGLAVAGTALAAYGAYKVTELSYNKAYEKYARQYIRDAESASNSSKIFNNFEENVAKSKSMNNSLLKSTSRYDTHYGQSDRLGKKLDNHLYTRIRRGTNFNPEVNDSLGLLEEEYSYDPEKGIHRQTVTQNKRMKINISNR